jgi:hypothetical protein
MSISAMHGTESATDLSAAVFYPAEAGASNSRSENLLFTTTASRAKFSSLLSTDVSGEK